MLRTSIIAGAVALAATCAAGGASSSLAATTSIGGPVSIGNANPTIEVASRHYKKRYWYRNHGWNGGPRYRYRHGAYRHFHGGYWYASPWWRHRGPTIALAIGPAYGGYGYNAYSGGGDHVQWCFDHYRSYDARSNTFMGYDGYRHECNSPYAY